MCDSRSAAAGIITRCIHVALGETALISISVYKFSIFDCSDTSERYTAPTREASYFSISFGFIRVSRRSMGNSCGPKEDLCERLYTF